MFIFFLLMTFLTYTFTFYLCSFFILSTFFISLSFFSFSLFFVDLFYSFFILYHKQGWPSGLRRQFKVLFSSEAWVRTPPLAFYFYFFMRCATIFSYFPFLYPCKASQNSRQCVPLVRERSWVRFPQRPYHFFFFLSLL